MTNFGVQLHGTFPMRRYPVLGELVERYPFTELLVHDFVWWRPVWPVLALLASHTERVLLGPDVTHPYLRHPADTASNVAALDELSGGRAVLGIGAGSTFDRLHIPVIKPRAAVRECVEIVNRFLMGERSTYQGEVFSVKPEAVFSWEPPRQRVPNFVGAFGPRMIADASTWADEIRTPAVWDPRFFEDFKQRAESAAAASDHKIKVGCDLWLSMDADRDVARKLGRQVLTQYLALPVFAELITFYDIDPEEVQRVGEAVKVGDVDTAAAAISDRTLDTFIACGTPADIINGLGPLLDAEPSTVVFSGVLGPDPEESIRALGEEVLPTLTAEF